MRKIKFRGFGRYSLKWHEGSLFCDKGNRAYISNSENIDDLTRAQFANSFIEVIPETVGQFTGLTDKNEKEIYEGDVVRGDSNGYIKWDNEDSSYEVEYHAFHKEWLCAIHYPIEIIGNIHDNPELLTNKE